MAGPTTQLSNAGENARIDPRGLLLRLAFAEPGESDLTAAEFEAAKAVVCSAGGLAYAYRVLDDAALLREHHDATPFDEDAPMHNALTELLLDDSLLIDDATALTDTNDLRASESDRTPADEGLIRRVVRALGPWRHVFAGGSLAAATTVALFFIPVDDTSAPPKPSGVKAPHRDAFVTPPFHLVDAATVGPISKALVLDALSRSVRELERCGATGQRWTLAWEISPDGIASNVATQIDPSTNDDTAKCIAAVVTHTAFPFQATATKARLTVDRVPISQ